MQQPFGFSATIRVNDVKFFNDAHLYLVPAVVESIERLCGKRSLRLIAKPLAPGINRIKQARQLEVDVTGRHEVARTLSVKPVLQTDLDRPLQEHRP